MRLAEKVTEMLKNARKRSGDSYIQAGSKIGIKADNVSKWERGEKDFTLSDCEMIAGYAGVSVKELLFGKEEEKQSGVMELEIYNRDDRLNVCKMLVDNGYAVSQGKRNKTPTGKQVIYFLRVTKDPNALVENE